MAGRSARDQVPPNCAEEETEPRDGGQHPTPCRPLGKRYSGWGGLPPPESGPGGGGHASQLGRPVAAGGKRRAESRAGPRAESCTWQPPGPRSRRSGRREQGPWTWGVGPPSGRARPATRPHHARAPARAGARKLTWRSGRRLHGRRARGACACTRVRGAGAAPLRARGQGPPHHVGGAAQWELSPHRGDAGARARPGAPPRWEGACPWALTVVQYLSQSGCCWAPGRLGSGLTLSEGEEGRVRQG